MTSWGRQGWPIHAQTWAVKVVTVHPSRCHWFLQDILFAWSTGCIAAPENPTPQTSSIITSAINIQIFQTQHYRTGTVTVLYSYYSARNIWLSLERVHQGLKNVYRLLMKSKFSFNECGQLQQLFCLSDKIQSSRKIGSTGTSSKRTELIPYLFLTHACQHCTSHFITINGSPRMWNISN